ncbi:MAG: hypothetical protein LUE93_08675 [Bacteroides sp.]|nr:hypothetical protein [Bacteroides sp.]
MNIRTLILDNQGRLLIGTDGEGLKEYNPATSRIEDSRTYAAPFDFSKAKIHSLLEDKDQNLWLGVFQKGLIMIPGTTNNFVYYGYKSVRHNTIGSSCVMAIFKDKSGVTWVGTDNDGLYAINDRGERLLHFRNEPGDPHSVPATITTIYEDSNNDLWIGSYFNGLAKVDKRNGWCQPFTRFSSVNNHANERISYITEDNHKNLWVGTYGLGVYRIDLLSGKVSHQESTRDENDDWQIDRLPNDWISCILTDRSGLIWIGTYNGLACYDTRKKRLSTLRTVTISCPDIRFIH